MFIISKIFLTLSDPGVVVLLLLVIGTFLLWLRPIAGKWLLAVTVVSCVIISTLPVGGLMIAALEDRFPVVTSVSGPVEGIIVLGGSVDQYLSQSRKQIVLNNGAERLTSFVALARQFPKAKLVFTGGSGRLDQTYKEADTARDFFTSIGLPESRGIYEDQSRNTFENGVFTHRLLKPKKSERWILITSARHMPRSMGVFRQLGWNLIPYPVDYFTKGVGKLGLQFNLKNGLGSLHSGMREWMGLAVYRILDRTDEFFPGPQQ
jgi:uncharacterized SAM-binding protein YcdF (DUF218 family)